MGILGDFRWYLRSRASQGRSPDGIWMADMLGRPCEVVAPRFWQLRRWWVWLAKADGYVEHTLFGPDGVARFYRFRTRTLPPQRPVPITLAGGKVVRATAPPIERLARRGADPHRRGERDDDLGRVGVTIKEPGEFQ